MNILSPCIMPEAAPQVPESKDWHTEVGGIEDAKNDIRQEFYEKRADLQGSLELTSQWQGGWKEINAQGGYLFGALLEGLGGSLSNKKSSQAKEVRGLLPKLNAAGLNVDQFAKGDKVMIVGTKLKVQRVGGRVTEEYDFGGTPKPKSEPKPKPEEKPTAEGIDIDDFVPRKGVTIDLSDPDAPKIKFQGKYVEFRMVGEELYPVDADGNVQQKDQEGRNLRWPKNDQGKWYIQNGYMPGIGHLRQERQER